MRPKRVARKLEKQAEPEGAIKETKVFASGNNNITQAKITTEYFADAEKDAHPAHFELAAASRENLEPNYGFRRSSRVRPHGYHPNYNTRFHPADAVLKPAHAAKFLNLVSEAPPTVARDIPVSKQQIFQLQESGPEQTPPNTDMDFSDSQIHFGADVTLAGFKHPHCELVADYNNLTDYDRCLYTLQMGAPLESEYLPLGWPQVLQTMWDFGFITYDEFQDPELIEQTIARYQGLQTSMRTFFQSRPEGSSRKNWIMFKPEGLDVYKCARGDKYWPKFINSVAQPTRASLGNEQSAVSTHPAKKPRIAINPEITSHNLGDLALFEANQRPCVTALTAVPSPVDGDIEECQSPQMDLEFLNSLFSSQEAVEDTSTDSTRLREHQPSPTGTDTTVASIQTTFLTDTAIPSRWFASLTHCQPQRTRPLMKGANEQSTESAFHIHEDTEPRTLLGYDRKMSFQASSCVDHPKENIPSSQENVEDQSPPPASPLPAMGYSSVFGLDQSIF
ncbi:uncharacterized protein KY384_007597 [Bacidia gigantensis]|uniref:uncharacterized protein n=1 Tax=Bacidia gigantensis TaxID=2732470 RepID=UPI001D0553A2|nr:uncharacterized protein KY384_007597 [Bacidia gigantensis]KAG8527445.1 hypothetical protein KY384_007597 [Bacidia gigantensis]